MGQRQYNALDIGKLVAALLVVAIHTNPLDNVDNAVAKRVFEVINTLAVPFFFMCSSYFFFMDKEKRKYKEKLFRFIRLYIIWSVLYIPLTIYGSMINQLSWKSSIWSLFKGYFLLGENYYSWQLWYLLALIYSLAMLCVLINRKVSVNLIGTIVVVLYLVSCTMEWLIANRGELSGVLLFGAKVVGATFVNGRLFTAPLYVFIGYILNKRECVNRRWLFFLTLFITGIMRSFITDTYLDGCLRAIMAICLFLILLTIKLPNSNWYKKIRKLSTVIYFTHMYIYFFVITITDTIKGVEVFLWTALISVCAGVAVLLVERRASFLGKIF